MAITGNHILVGLGGTGGKILKAFKMRMFEEFPTSEERSKLPVSILYVDSTDEMMPQNGKARPDFRVMGQDASFTKNEFLNIKEVDVEHLLDHINNYPTIRGIVDNVGAVRSAIGSLGQAAGQKRRAGRLLFAANAVGYVNSLRDAYARAERISGIGDPRKTTIHIFAGLAGGTGSGAIVDAIVQARKTFPDSKILAYVMIPELHLPKADMDQGRYYQNGYAAMNELNALQAGRWFPHDVTGKGPAKLYNDRIKGVADGLTVYSNVNENGVTVNSLNELPTIVGDYVFARIFHINSDNEINSDIIRAYNFENMDEFALEFDEIGEPDEKGRIPAARTKKLNSFGIKRVIYPELRVLKHITYSTALSILLQFKFNNWNENKGFINEEKNKDYRKAYLDADNLSHWMLDLDHLTLNTKILPSDANYPKFNDYWHDKAYGFAEVAKENERPLNELDNILKDFYNSRFREEGVEAYFTNKERVIPEMVKEIRSVIEKELFDKWKIGDVSIVELQKVSKLLLETVEGLRNKLEEESNAEKGILAEIDEERNANVREWSDLRVLERMIGRGARLFAKHQDILTDYYDSKTRLIALEFAKKLAARLFVEIGKMDNDISAFGKVISDAVDETEKLIVAQQKVNKGLEDMRGAIVEVSEDETMKQFEIDIQVDKTDMPNLARTIREHILPQEEFTNFGKLANDIAIDDIVDAFDIKLSELVKIKHNERADAQDKVLGLNILSQLQQKLRTDDDIREFAHTIVNQSGGYLKLNNDQIQLHLHNNEGNLSPSNPASINKRSILVSIPAPEESTSQKRFADKLEEAFKNSFNQSTARTTITFTRESPRKDELSIVTVNYCFPARSVEWLSTYKQKYEDFLDTGNETTDVGNAILLHTEGNGHQLPSLFAVDNAEEILEERKRNKMSEPQENKPVSSSAGTSVPPVSGPVPPPVSPTADNTVPPIIPAEPQVSVYMAVNGQQYGPFSYEQCKQMVPTRQLTPQTLVWFEGMSSWKPAGEVNELKNLFAPSVPPVPGAPTGMPPIQPA